MTLALRYAARTHPGLVRPENEDSGYAGPNLLAVADGMGGMVAGELASAITIASVKSLDGPVTADAHDALQKAAEAANARISERIASEPHLEGMGTTLTAMLFDGQRIGVAHIGDSRGYLLRGGTLRQLTHDHTFVQSLIDEGRLTRAEAERHPHRALIIRALQGRPEDQPDFATVELEPGDRLLLCSDGLMDGPVPDEMIEQTLGEHDDIDDAAIALVNLALRAGGPDNVTCVVAEVVEPNGTAAALGAVPLVVGSAAEPLPEALDPPSTEITSDQGSLLGSPETPGPDTDLAVHDDIDEELRYAPRPPGRFRWVLRTLVALVLLGLVGVGGWWAYGWTQRQYYVGPYTEENAAAANGQPEVHVAIYRGIAQQLPGFDLSGVFEVMSLQVDALPPYQQDQVDETIPANDLTDARRIVARLEADAAECAARGKQTPTPTPSASRSSRSAVPTRTPAAVSPQPSKSAQRDQVEASLPRPLADDSGAPPECAGVDSPGTGEK